MCIPNYVTVSFVLSSPSITQSKETKMYLFSNLFFRHMIKVEIKNVGLSRVCFGFHFKLDSHVFKDKKEFTSSLYSLIWCRQSRSVCSPVISHLKIRVSCINFEGFLDRVWP